VIQNRPVILALDSLKQENLEFEANLDYIVRPHLKKPKNFKKRTYICQVVVKA
jgi:hypothetical protein